MSVDKFNAVSITTATNILGAGRAAVDGVSIAGGGGFVPPTGNNLWFLADGLVYNTGTTPCTDGQTVATWVDNAGTSNATEATNKPIWKSTAGPNSKPVVRFDGTNDILQTGNFSSNMGSVFIVVGNLGTPSFISPLGKNGAGTEKRLVTFADATDLYSPGDANDLFGNTFSSWVNGASTLTFPASPTFAVISYLAASPVTWTTNPFSIGGSAYGFFHCDIAEILTFDTVLGTSDRQSVENYLLAKYSLP